jgi:hypothetical protein
LSNSFLRLSRDVIHLSNQYNSLSLCLDNYTVVAWVLLCCFLCVSPLLWLCFAPSLHVVHSVCVWCCCLPSRVDVRLKHVMRGRSDGSSCILDGIILCIKMSLLFTHFENCKTYGKIVMNTKYVFHICLQLLFKIFLLRYLISSSRVTQNPT